MGASLRLRSLGIVVLTLLTLALGAAGHAHHVPSPEDNAIQAYLLAGGDLEALCDGRGHDHVALPGCPVCHLVDAAIVPPPAGTLLDLPRRLLALAEAPPPAPGLAAPRDPSHSQTGPPRA